MVTDLVGRERELCWLTRAAAEGGVVAVVGHPGVGKTAVAVAAAHQMAPRFRGGCLAVDLRGTDEQPLDTHSALDKLLRALGVPAATIPVAQDERSTLLARLAASRGILLLLDNVSGEAQVRSLAVTSPGCLTLVTAQGALAGLESVRLLWLEPFTDSDALQLLTGIVGGGRVAAEPEAARELVALCGGLPLAVRVAGNRLATRPQWTLDYLVSRLRDAGRAVPRATNKPGDTSPFALGLLLRRAHSRAAGAMAEAVRPFGIELRHFAVLIQIANNGPANQRDLAAAIGFDKVTMVRIVDDLEAAGYATRRTDPADRRARTVDLTGRGMAVFDAAHVAAAPIADQVTAHLTDAEREQLVDLLIRFTNPPEGH